MLYCNGNIYTYLLSWIIIIINLLLLIVLV